MLVRAAVAVVVILAVYAALRLWRLPPRRLRRIDLPELGVAGPAIVQFSTPTCSPCKAAAPRLRAAAEEAAVAYAQVDVEARGDVARRYSIRTVPTIAMVERGGGVVDVWTTIPADAELVEAARRARPGPG